jgi:hypothetical protein
VLIEEAAKTGKPTEAGIGSVALGQRTIAERAGTRQATVSRALPGLEEDGWIATEPRTNKDAPNCYVLLTGTGQVTRAYHEGQKRCKADAPTYNVSFSLVPFSLHPDTGTSPDDLKRLRWSYVAKVREDKRYVYEHVERLGPICGHAVECLNTAGGALTVNDLIRAMSRTDRPSRFVERHVSKLVSYGLAVLEGDTVWLTDDWQLKLVMARQIGDEYGAEDRAKERHKWQQEAYKNRHETKADPAPTQRDMDEARWERMAKKPDGRTRELGRESEHFRDVFVGGDDAQQPLGSDYPECKRRMKMVLEEPESKPEPERNLPPKVAGVYQHGPECACWLCG